MVYYAAVTSFFGNADYPENQLPGQCQPSSIYHNVIFMFKLKKAITSSTQHRLALSNLNTLFTGGWGGGGA